MADVSGRTLNPNLYAMGSGVGYNPSSANPYAMATGPFAPPADTFNNSSLTEEQKKKRRKNAQTFLMAAAGIAAAVVTGVICKKVFFPPKPLAKLTPTKSFETSSIDSSGSSASSVVKQPVQKTKKSGIPISKGGGGKRFGIDIMGKERFIQHPASLIRHPSSLKANRSWMGNISKCENPSYFSPALKRTLSKITAKDTLALTAHGDTEGLACFNAKELADFLKRHGLKEVGTIKLKSCDVGVKLEKNSFLESFSKELTKNGISHKAIQGYQGLYNSAYKFVVLRKPNGKHSLKPIRASKATRTVYN